jgi:hypothetical protein
MLVGGGVRLPRRVGLQRVDELIASTTEAREDDDGQNPERWCAGESLQHSGSNAAHLQSVVARRVASRAARWVPVTLGALFLAACVADPVAPRGPNLLIITIDTIRADHTSAYGYDRDTTPTLARLAEGGVLFEVP